MKIVLTTLAATLLLATACRKSKDDPGPNPDIIYKTVSETFKSYTPRPTPSSRFEYVGSISEATPKVAMGILMSWEINPNGMYMYPNNRAGGLVTGEHGLIKALAVNTTINASTPSWQYDAAALSYDYVTNTTGSKGDLAGKGDQYIGFNTIQDDKRYYGWAKVNVSTDGRTVKLIEYAVQKKPETAIKVGEK